jgi:hypothetical protein
VEDDFKQGAGELRACGPSTFFIEDSFIKYGEVVPVRGSLCASADKIAVNNIDQTENGNVNENVHEKTNAKKSVDTEIDLSAKTKKIESSTQNEPIATEQDFITHAEPLSTIDPIDDAEPVDTGDSCEEIDALDRNVIS